VLFFEESLSLCIAILTKIPLSSINYCYTHYCYYYLLTRIRKYIYKMLSYRRETALQGALQFSPKVEDWNWEMIFDRHYRSIFNHYDTIDLKICRIL